MTLFGSGHFATDSHDKKLLEPDPPGLPEAQNMIKNIRRPSNAKVDLDF